MTLHRPFRFFAPTLAVVLAAAAGAAACGSVVDVANTNSPDASVPIDGSPDGGLSPDAQPDAATTDGGVSAASWEVRFLPWDNQGFFNFSVFDQTVVATPSSASSGASYVLDLTTRGTALDRLSLYEGTPIVGTFRGGSPRGKVVAFEGAGGTTFYDVGPGGATVRTTVPAATLPIATIGFHVGDDGSWGVPEVAGAKITAVFDGPNGAERFDLTGLVNAELFPEERVAWAQDPATGNTFLVTGKGRIPLGPLSDLAYIPGRLLVRPLNAAATDVWSLGAPPQKLGTVTLAGTQLARGSDTFYSADGTGVRLAAAGGAPGVTKTPFTSPSLQKAGNPQVGGFVRNAGNDVLVVEGGAAVLGGAVLSAAAGMSLGRLVPGGAVAFSGGNPIAAGSGGFVAWSVDGAKALPPVGFSVRGEATRYAGYTQTLYPAAGALAMRSTFSFSLGGREVMAEFGSSSSAFAKRAEGQTGLFDRNASTPRWLPRTGLASNSYDAVADRGFTALRDETGNTCLYQYGVTETWVATGRCLAGTGVADNASDAFALATATEVQISLPGLPTLRAPSPSLSKIAFDGKRLLGFDRTSTVYVFEIQGDRLVKVFERLVPGVRSVALDANSDRGMIGLEDGAALLVAK